MARKIIDIGLIGNDGTGDSIRDSFRKVNENFYEVYGALGLGERLNFLNLGDTPDSFEGLQNNEGITPILTTNSADDPTGLIFKQLVAGEGITVSYPVENEIILSLDFETIYSQELLASSLKLGDSISISEFSNDPTFGDNSTSSLATEYAIRAYIDKRLGISHAGSTLSSTGTIPVGGGFLPLSGQVAMRGDINLEDPDTPGTYYTIVNLKDPVNPRDAVNLQSMEDAISTAITGGDAITDTSISANADIAQSKLALNLLQGLAAAPTGTAADKQAASGVGSVDSAYFTVTDGWVTITANGISYDRIQQLGARTVLGNDLNVPGNVIELDLDNILTGGGSITDTSIAADADIAQSKLLMNITTTAAAAPTGTAAQIQAASGLSSFDTTYFDITNGWVTIKPGSIGLSALPEVNARSVLGNPSFAPAQATNVTFEDVIDDGLGIKKNQYVSTGVLRRTSGSSNVLDADYSVIDVATTNTGNTLVQRDGNGDFAARIVSVGQLKVDAKLVLDTQTIGSGGVIRIYGWNSSGGILLGSGTNTVDKVNYYDNELHRFRNQAGTADGGIRAATIQVTTLTTGGETTAGTVTGRWSLSGSSRMESTYSADLAEYYEGDKEYPQGTVLVFGGDKEVTTTTKEMDTRIAGVVSHDAAFAMYKACPGYKNLVALQGRVPCRVVGKVRKGDLMITSSVPGVAVSAKEDAKAGSIIGKALENYDSDHIGVIEVAVGRS